MTKQVSDCIVISLVLIAFILLVIFIIPLTIMQLEDGFSMFIMWTYFATGVFFLVIVYIHLARKRI